MRYITSVFSLMRYITSVFSLMRCTNEVYDVRILNDVLVNDVCVEFLQIGLQKGIKRSYYRRYLSRNVKMYYGLLCD